MTKRPRPERAGNKEKKSDERLPTTPPCPPTPPRAAPEVATGCAPIISPARCKPRDALLDRRSWRRRPVCLSTVRSLERDHCCIPENREFFPSDSPNQHEGEDTSTHRPKQPCLRASCPVVQQTLQSSATTNGSPRKRSSRLHAGERPKS